MACVCEASGPLGRGVSLVSNQSRISTPPWVGFQFIARPHSHMDTHGNGNPVILYKQGHTRDCLPLCLGASHLCSLPIY